VCPDLALSRPAFLAFFFVSSFFFYVSLFWPLFTSSPKFRSKSRETKKNWGTFPFFKKSERADSRITDRLGRLGTAEMPPPGRHLRVNLPARPAALSVPSDHVSPPPPRLLREMPGSPEAEQAAASQMRAVASTVAQHLYVQFTRVQLLVTGSWFFSGILFDLRTRKTLSSARTEVQRRQVTSPVFESALHFDLGGAPRLEQAGLELSICHVESGGGAQQGSVETLGSHVVPLTDTTFVGVPGSKAVRHAQLPTVVFRGQDHRRLAKCTVQLVLSNKGSLENLRKEPRGKDPEMHSETFARYVGASAEMGRDPERAFSLLSLDSVAPLAGTHGPEVDHRRTLHMLSSSTDNRNHHEQPYVSALRTVSEVGYVCSVHCSCRGRSHRFFLPLPSRPFPR
jgi:hypothetical protein